MAASVRPAPAAGHKLLAGPVPSASFGDVDRLASPPRFWTLDALRGLVAIVVFLSHWHLWSAFVPVGAVERFVRAFLDNCYATVVFATWPTGAHHPAVLGFFVLSGFCIHYPYEWRRTRGDLALPVGQYYRRRFRRIMPAYWVASLLGLAFVLAEHLRPSGLALLQFHSQSSPLHALVRFGGVAGLFPEEVFVGNYILNTVASEIVVYAVYPLFHHLAMRRNWPALGLTFLGMHAAAIALLVAGADSYWVFNSIFMLGLFWFAGAWMAHLFVGRSWRPAGGWILLAWVLFLASKAVPYFYGLNLLRQALWGAVCALGLLWILGFEQRIRHWDQHRSIRALCFLGLISYSLYAAHTPMMLLATWVLATVLHTENYLLQLAATLTAGFGAALASYYWVERPFYRPPPTPAGPAGGPA